MKCSTIENLKKKYGDGFIPADKLIKHWNKCQKCKKTIEMGIKLQNKNYLKNYIKKYGWRYR